MTATVAATEARHPVSTPGREAGRPARGSTPRHYRILSIAVSVALVAAMAAGVVFYVATRNATTRLKQNTGPVLVATQSLVASLAEADAAATTAFLSGKPEDRDQRNEYLDSLARADRQLEQIAALVGNDPAAHRVIQDLGVSVSRYAALIEAARAENLNGVPGAPAALVDAVNLLSGTVAGDAASLTTITEHDFNTERHNRSGGAAVAFAIAALALAFLVWVQVDIARRSRRILNPALVLASLLLAGVLVWLVTADVRAGDDIALAKKSGYDSIALTARIQSEGFASKSEETLALITGDAGHKSAADRAATVVGPATVTDDQLAAVRQGRLTAKTAPPGLLFQAATTSDSTRKRAAVAELMVRWQRYRQAVAALRQAGGDASRQLAVGQVSSTFNGFNVSVESVLGDSRTEFAAALDRGGHRSSGLDLVVVIGLAVAVALALAGHQARINEYR